MRAVQIREPGGPEVLELVERPTPQPGPREVLIRVEAAGVSRPDVWQRMGFYPPPPGVTDIPGLEVAGTVAAIGAAVERWKPGDAVCALVAGGGYAEQVAAPMEQVLPIPAGWTAREAATLPENLFTVWANVIDRGRLEAGETLLVHGGAGGIGSAAIMLGRALGARVFATAGSAKRCLACLEIGAERAFDYKTEDFVAGVMDATGGHGADVVLDVVGAAYVERNLELLATDGRLCLIASTGRPEAHFDVMRLLMKRLTITGSTLRARTPEQKGRIARALEAEAWPHCAARRIRPLIDASFPLAEARHAHQRLDSGAHVGKIVLAV